MGNMAPRVLPNLLIIGAAKCGTTSLHNYLNSHPDIAMSHTKEPSFFLTDGSWDRGVEWYARLFDPAACVRGESSTRYTSLPSSDGVARRIAEVLGSPKLIYMVRDPVERLIAHYHHRRARGAERRTLKEALADPANDYLLMSCYTTQLVPFLEEFGRDQLLIETQERLLSEREPVLRRIFRFLDVCDDVPLTEAARIWESSAGKGWGYRLYWKTADTLKRRGVKVPSALRWPAQRLIRTRLMGGRSTAASKPTMDSALLSIVRPRLQLEVDQLRRLTGLPLDDWSI